MIICAIRFRIYFKRIMIIKLEIIKGAIYCSIHNYQNSYDKMIYIIEMNNDTNKIIAISYIKNKFKNEKKIYYDNYYNFYTYSSKYYFQLIILINQS